MSATVKETSSRMAAGPNSIAEWVEEMKNNPEALDRLGEEWKRGHEEAMKEIPDRPHPAPCDCRHCQIVVHLRAAMECINPGDGERLMAHYARLIELYDEEIADNPEDGELKAIRDNFAEQLSGVESFLAFYRNKVQ
jgi:hypothetical protein